MSEFYFMGEGPGAAELVELVHDRVASPAHDGATLRCEWVRPAGATHPGLVLVHDEFGPSEHLSELAQRLARSGFAVLAPDFYTHRRRPEFAPDAPPDIQRAYLEQLPDAELVAEIRAALRWLRSQPDTGARVGLLGFGMGATCALLSMAEDGHADAAVLFGPQVYFAHTTPGQRYHPLERARYTGGPVLALYGADDPLVPGDQQRHLSTLLRSLEQECDVHAYPGAGRHFFRAGLGDYDRRAAADAWERLRAWFEEYLREPRRPVAPPPPR